MNYLSIAENVTAAVFSAVLVAASVWMYSWLRNLILERQLVDAINPGGVGVGFDQKTHKGSFTLQVQNCSNATIRVREIVLMADMFYVSLRPSRDKPLNQTPLTNELVRPIFKRKHLSQGSLEPDNNPDAMLLPPKTSGWWDAWPEDIGAREWIVKDIFMVFEYATIFGNSALVRIRAPASTLSLVKTNFEPLSKAVHNRQSFDFFHGIKGVRNGA